MRLLVVSVTIMVAALAIYARTAGCGFLSDDFGWLVGAQQFEASRLGDFNIHHFYRPVLHLYFRAAFAACGREASCYHWLSIALHVATSLLVVALVTFLSRNRALGGLAGVLFAVQAAPVEAVIWVSAVTEVIATSLFVLTVWLFCRARNSGRRTPYVLAFLSFVACLLTHESGIMLLPVLILAVGLLPEAVPHHPPPANVLRSKWVPFIPFCLALAVYAVIAYIVNSQSYLITEGRYGIGTHMASNMFRAFVTLAIAQRKGLGVIIVGAFCVWAAVASPRRVRFYMLWTLVTLIPFTGFHWGLSSRYLYLPAVGFAGLTAELLWWTRPWLERLSRGAVLVWWVVTLALTVRFASFAVKNAHNWERASAPYREYAASVRKLHPAPGVGALLEVPPPPKEVGAAHILSLLQWEYSDPTLRVVVLGS